MIGDGEPVRPSAADRDPASAPASDATDVGAGTVAGERTAAGSGTASTADAAAAPDGPKCVVCHEPLVATAHGWGCACGAELWFLGQVEMVGGLELRLTLTGEALDDPPHGRPCPLCAAAFAVVYLPTDQPHGGRPEWQDQRVDVCLPCRVVWTDPGEFAHIGDPVAASAEHDTHHGASHLVGLVHHTLTTPLPVGELHLPRSLVDGLRRRRPARPPAH